MTRQFQCDLPRILAKHNTIARHYWRSCTFRDTLMQPFHLSAQTELLNAIDLQHATLEHIALVHQFQCTQSVSTHAKHNSTAAAKKRISLLEPSVPVRAQFETDSTAKRRRPQPSRKRGNFSAQRNLRLPEETHCFVQILTFKSHPWCNSSNAICQEYLQNTIQSQVTTPLLCCSTSTSTLLFSSLLYSTSTLPLTGGNDLCASENVTSWSLDACAHWTQWSLG